VKRQAGVTLLELLIVVAIIGLITAGASRALMFGLDTERRLRDDTRREDRIASFERQVSDLVQQAFLSSTANDPNTYFIATFSEGQQGLQPGGNAQGPGADDLVFTAVGGRLRSDVTEETGDFEGANERFGPQGGMTEIELSTVGFDAPAEAQGLFVREQRPADGDPSQGGFQRVLNPDVETIQFEFFDGGEWRMEWDSRSTEANRLPAAVRMRYKLRDEEEERTLTIRLPHSDVTPLNPVTQGGAG